MNVRKSAIRVSRSTLFVEMLEGRTLLSTTTLRIVAYNVAADTNGNTTAGAGISTVLQGIGACKVAGSARPIDVLALEETTSNAATVQPIVNALNAIYGTGTYAESALQLTESGGDPSTGNGPSALIYNTKTISLLQSYALPTVSSTSGVYRQIGRYELAPLGGVAASDFYMYVDHYKSGTGTTNASKRQQEAVVVRNDEATLPTDARVLYVGDLNTNLNGEGIFTTLMSAGQGQAFDPRLPGGGIGNVDQSVAAYSESSTNLRYRDDYELVTQNVLSDASGLKIVAGSEQAFGNNGTVPAGGSVTASSNTALASLSNGAAVLQALTTASDHLPVFADYTDVVQLPAGSVAGTASGAPAGTTIYLDANGNGALDASEQRTTTAGNGTYAFASVQAGSYTIRQTLSSGFVQSSPANSGGIAITVADGSRLTGQNFVDAAATTPPPTTSAKLTGTAIGTSGSFLNNGNTIAKALDGNLSTYFDGPTASGNTVGLDLGSTFAITSIAYASRSGFASRMNGGTFQASNSATFASFVTLYTINVAANPPAGALTTQAVSTGGVGYRYVRYVAPASSYGDVAEVQFFGTSTTTTPPTPPAGSPTKLTGTTIGTGNATPGYAITNATDGNLATAYDSATKVGAWVGLDFGTVKTIKQIAYAPRTKFEYRMNGGKFQISTTADFSSGITTLYTFTAAPASGVLTTLTLSAPVTARYVRFLSADGGYGDISEFQVFG